MSSLEEAIRLLRRGDWQTARIVQANPVPC